MVKLILLTLFTIFLLIIGGCIVTPSGQQLKVDETPITSEMSSKSRIIYIDGEKFWAMDEHGQNPQVIWDCPARFECENLSPDWKMGVYLEKGEQSWNVHLREQEKEDGRILMANVPQDKEFASSWSPNGRKLLLLFYSVVEGKQKKNELYLVNIETGEVKLLDTGISDSTWSPDSRKIVYYDFRSQGHGWYILDLETGNRIQITDTTLVEGRETWSPDSKRVALTITKIGAAIGTSTYVKDLGTGTLTNIQNPDQYTYKSATNPAWSPDGNKIAYIADYFQPGEKIHFSTLFIHDIASGKQTPLIEQAQRDKIIWSPDSQKVIYESHQDRNYYLIEINTKQITKILDGEVGDIIVWE